MRFLRAADEVLPIHLEFVLHHRLQLEKANKKDLKNINPFFHCPEQRKGSLSSQRSAGVIQRVVPSSSSSSSLPENPQTVVLRASCRAGGGPTGQD